MQNVVEHDWLCMLPLNHFRCEVDILFGYLSSKVCSFPYYHALDNTVWVWGGVNGIVPTHAQPFENALMASSLQQCSQELIIRGECQTTESSTQKLCIYIQKICLRYQVATKWPLQLPHSLVVDELPLLKLLQLITRYLFLPYLL